jgi:hypothetical protein
MRDDLRVIAREIIALRSLVEDLQADDRADSGDRDSLAKARLNLTAALRLIEDRIPLW